MSAQNKQEAVTAKNRSMVVGDGKHHRRRLDLHLRVVSLIVGCLIVVGLIGWGGVVAFRYIHTSTKAASPSTSKEHENSPKVDLNSLNTEEKYHYLADSGDYGAAEQALEAALPGAKDKTSRLSIYSQQSAVALQFKKYDDAKAYADKALQLDSGSTIPYVTLAHWAGAQGNKTLAIEYWQQAISRLDKSAPQYSLLQQEYEANVRSLEK